MKIRHLLLPLLIGLSYQSNAMFDKSDCGYKPVSQSKTEHNAKFEYIRRCEPVDKNPDFVMGVGALENYKDTKFRVIIVEKSSGEMSSWGVKIVDDSRGIEQGIDQNKYVDVNAPLEQYQVVAEYLKSMVPKIDCINNDTCLRTMLGTEHDKHSGEAKKIIKDFQILVETSLKEGTLERYTDNIMMRDYHEFSLYINTGKGGLWSIHFERDNDGNVNLSGILLAE